MGLLEALGSFSPLNHAEWPTTIWVLALSTIIGLLFQLAWRPSFPKNAPTLWKPKDWPIVGAIAYFSDRKNFLVHGSQASKTGSFSYYLGKHQVVNTSGKEGRKTFFESKELSMAEG